MSLRVFFVGSALKKSETSRLKIVLDSAAAIVRNDHTNHTAANVLQLLITNIDIIHDAVTKQDDASRQRLKSKVVIDTDENFMFTYEEESDPEIFFVPYVWETIVCAVTSSTIEWNIKQIQVFHLLKDQDDDLELDEDVDDNNSYEMDFSTGGEDTTTNVGHVPHFARDISDIL